MKFSSNGGFGHLFHLASVLLISLGTVAHASSCVKPAPGNTNCILAPGTGICGQAGYLKKPAKASIPNLCHASLDTCREACLADSTCKAFGTSTTNGKLVCRHYTHTLQVQDFVAAAQGKTTFSDRSCFARNFAIQMHSTQGDNGRYGIFDVEIGQDMSPPGGSKGNEFLGIISFNSTNPTPTRFNLTGSLFSTQTPNGKYAIIADGFYDQREVFVLETPAEAQANGAEQEGAPCRLTNLNQLLCATGARFLDGSQSLPGQGQDGSSSYNVLNIGASSSSPSGFDPVTIYAVCLD